MNTIFLDFETYYDDEYSLRKMTPVEYVLDPRFECQGCGIKHGLEGKAYWRDGPDMPAFFQSLDPRVTSLVTHNALFDMCIVAWRFGFNPRLMVDTMGVAQALLKPQLRSVSLNSVAMHLGLGVKGNTLIKVKGMHLDQIKAAGLYTEFVDYGLGDVDLCAGIYDKLVRSGQFPISELVIMDMILRCAIEPKFRLDRDALALHLATTIAEKEQLIASVAGDRSVLSSNEQFAALLRSNGVEPPTKISPATGKETYAFAKKDPEFLELEEHPNPRIQALVAARMGVKSTIEETRTQRLISIANLEWPGVTPEGNRPALLPVPLRFSGAHTHRFSGDWKLNLQNLPTRNGNNAIRRALMAPPGHSVVTVDSAQIQARLYAWLCGQQDLVDQFANKEDVYSIFASDVFQRPVNRKAKLPDGSPDMEQVAMGFVGKTGILGLGFGVGAVTIQNSIKVDSKAQLGVEMDLSPAEAVNLVSTFRTKYDRVPAGWRALQYEGTPVLANGGEWAFGPCVFTKNRVSLPSGLHLHYHDLHYENNEWTFTYGGKPKRIYGGKLLENLAQALERVIIMEAAIRIQRRTDAPCPLRLALQGHDELVYVVPTQHASTVRPILEQEMSVVPAWASGLPLAAESGEGLSYGDAK